MAQVAPNTDTVQDRYVESLMLSGSRFVSSILPPGSHIIAAAAIPVFYREAIITGPEVIGEAYAPPLLTCEAESHRSSPRGVLTYQWKRDAVNIGSATASTYTTVAADVGTTITCFVTATNASGADTSLSNGIAVVARTPTDLFEMDVVAIQGLSQLDRIDANDVNLVIVSGIANAEKLDNNEMDVYAMHGTIQPDSIAVDEVDAYAMTGMASLEDIAVSESDAYAMFHPVSLTDLVVVNGDAENSVMTDWTMDTNDVFSVTSAGGFGPAEGTRFFAPEDLGQGIDSQMSQVIVIPGGDLTDVDTGLCYCIARLFHTSTEGHDTLVVTLEALNAADGVLDTEVWNVPVNDEAQWLYSNSIDNILNLPTLTRKVKITVLFKAHDTLGSTANTVYADDIGIALMKTA